MEICNMSSQLTYTVAFDQGQYDEIFDNRATHTTAPGALWGMTNSESEPGITTTRIITDALASHRKTSGIFVSALDSRHFTYFQPGWKKK